MIMSRPLRLRLRLRSTTILIKLFGRGSFSRATNQPVLAVYNDLDNAEQEHRAALTRNIVSGNDKLAAYIRGNELADVVSNDDYGIWIMPVALLLMH